MINNWYPVEFNDKCMGWTWFISCYVQLSLFLPMIVLFYKRTPGLVITIVYLVIIVVFWIVNISITEEQGIGMIPALNDKFYTYIFMRPYYHFNSYFTGAMLGL
jgi:surface polysaccharide O-acyltransferase-like enzyme